MISKFVLEARGTLFCVNFRCSAADFVFLASAGIAVAQFVAFEVFNVRILVIRSR